MLVYLISVVNEAPVVFMNYPLSNINLDISFHSHFDGFVQERRNSIALAMELRLSCTNPSISSSLNLCDSEILPNTQYILVSHFTGECQPT